MTDARNPTPSSTLPSNPTKVTLAGVGLVMLVVLGVGLAVAFVGAIGTGADAVERHARYTAAVDAAALHAKGMANNERGFLIDGDDEFVAQLEGRAELVRASFDTAMAAADDQQRSTVLEAREAFDRWRSLIEQELALYRSGDEDGAIEMSLTEVRTLRWTYEGWLADARSLGVAGFQDATTAMGIASMLSVIVLLGYLVLAAAIAVVVVLWILRAAVRPSSELARTLTDDGDKPEPTTA
jgi:methyl-accepting chemotaxis protein